MGRKVVALDMDDTLCHLVQRAVDLHNVRYPGHGLDINQIVEYDVSKFWHPDCTMKDFFGQEHMCRDLDVFDAYMVEEVRKLTQEYEVIVITAASPYTVLDKWLWMEKHLPFIPYADFFVASRKTKIEFDLLIDDAPRNLREVKEAGRFGVGLLRPWNRELQGEFPLRESWEGMSGVVRGLLG